MGTFYLCMSIFRIVLPLLLLAAIIFRPSVISGIYLLFFFILPWLPLPTTETMAGKTGLYLKLLLALSVLTTLLQVIFQIVLIALPPYAHFLENCSLLEKVLRHVGFVKLNNISVVAIFTWLSPEIIMLVSSLVAYIFLSKLTTPDVVEDGSSSITIPKAKKRLIRLSTALGKYISLLSLCLAAVLRPSIPGGIYFLVFLSAATWWATYRDLNRGYAIVLRCVIALVVVHFTVLFAYQMQWLNELLDGNSSYARYFGLTPLMKEDCDDPRNIYWVDAEWASYLNPIILLWLYYILTLESTLLLMPQVENIENGESSEKTPLIRGVSPSQKYGGIKKTTIIQDSTGSVTVTSDGQDDIPLEPLGMDSLEGEDEPPTLIDNILYGIEYILQVLIRSSYIITNIIMMTWSITFHSWITFVLLLSANILWIVPNQRKSMLRFSPFLVIYAWFLLISGYIYSMNLNDTELPRTIDNVDLGLIGFVKVTEYPYKYLLIKCLYTSMFWITLRQYMKERKEARQTSALADMVAPLQVTVGTAGGLPRKEEEGNETIKLVGNFVKNILMRFWIWVVAITLFGVAITGERMTGFRIVYMTLFLVFILSFQMSFRVWRRIMFGFWLTVILYSMLILILVYTYQFPNIQMYWTDYLHISKAQQEDIGLEDYGPKQLFIRLVTPTFFVIITVIQLHYYHNDLMKLYEPKSILGEPVSYGSSGPVGAIDADSEKSDIETSKFDVTDASTSIAQIQMSMQHMYRQLHGVTNIVFTYLELHLHKIVLLVVMCLCVFDVCAIHFALVLLTVLSFIFGRPFYVFAIFIVSVVVSLMLLARMLYQIQYINHDYWNVTCEGYINTTTNYTYQFNNAEWLGFKKSDSTTSFSSLVQWNIIVILAITLWSIVLTRQSNYRISKGLPDKRPLFMFKNVKRCDADKDIRTCLKYFFNFGYYKFGLEFCLIMIVAIIGLRLDMYAIFYAIWLCIVVSLQRNILVKVWPAFLIFIAILIPIQYVMIVGLPPGLCIDYPWDKDTTLRRLQEWAFLTDNHYSLPSKKILYDFILLILVARQALVFRIEMKNVGVNYPGGSNASIIHQAEDPGFIIPVPDFITYSRSYLDIFKRAIFLSHMWIALAVVFLAGANRVNIFSIGYLIGSFVFLWLGSDLYLRPIPNIIRSWNWLFGYNVVVILVKTFLELAGCLYIDQLKLNSCWFVQLMAIGCTNRYNQEKLVVDNKLVEKCVVNYENIGLVWDGICFAFLLLQRRIFQSYYFFHVVDETKATTILASRGADLIEDLRHKRIRQQETEERTILEKIKAKMDRIKANQQKIKGPYCQETDNHYVDGIFKKRPRYQKHVPKTNKEAIRSGDYYMFDELDDDEELDLIEENILDIVPDNSDTSLKRGATISEVEVDGEKHESTKLKTTNLFEPKPSTSKDEDISELSEPRDPTVFEKVMGYFLFIWNILQCSMVSLTLFLNKYSKDYRFILNVLNKEKKMLKERTNYNHGLRVGRAKVWQPIGSYLTLVKQSLRQDESAHITYEEDAGELSSIDQPPVIRLLLAMWYIVLSHSNILCYFMIFLNQVQSATFLSLPLPFMVFLWGTLTVPRPSKTFWVTIIAYTEVIVLIKCVFQFEILPWNIKQSVSPFYPPRIIGIEKKGMYALWDLLLLLIVFFHRYLLKCLGLWKSAYVPAIILPDGKYKITRGELQRIEENDDDSLNRKTPKVVTKDDTEKINTGSTDELSKKPDDENIQKSDDQDQSTVKVKTDVVGAVTTKYPTSLGMAVREYAGDFQLFFKELLGQRLRLPDDVYSYMFLCDFFNFFVILIGYSSFGAQQGDQGVSEYLEDNRVPGLFLLMLILQFALIIIDRAIFLRKQLFGKVVFQILQIILLHIWLFILYPLLTDRAFNSVIPPQMYYMVKCFYLLVSAYQIRSGYPTRILGNFLCKGYNYFNLILFKGFLAVPFLYELRTVMDWMWTDTSMTVFDWVKMEDIFAHIYQLKCSRHIENEYPQPRGKKKSPVVKYLVGGAALALMIAIIWFPLVFFSLGNTVGKPNIPKDVSLDLRIGPYQPIYQMTVQSNSIFPFREIDLQNTITTYEQNRAAITFMSNYEAKDIAAIKFSTDSATVWSISPPDRKRMIDEIATANIVTIRLGYQISHESSSKEDTGIVKGEVELDLPDTIDGSPNPLRVLLYTVLNGSVSDVPIPLPHLFPKFLKVTNKGTSKSLSVFMNEVGSPKDTYLRNITVQHEEEVTSPGQVGREWWVLKEVANDTNDIDYLNKLPYADPKDLVMYMFNDKVFPSTLSFITAGGIIGVYTTIVLVAGRLLRGFLSGMCFKIMFDDLPNVDRILQLCYDVYLVREAREFSLEEDLFAKLVFLFRSPETLIKWTRPKEEVNDDDEEGDEQPQQ